jgi:hypothetical protein
MDPNKSGKIRHFKRGEIRVWPKMPINHWEPLDSAMVDFAEASYDLLMASNDWDQQHAINWLRETYGIEAPQGLDTERFVTFLITTRERQVGLIEQKDPLRASSELAKRSVRRVKSDEKNPENQE